MNEDIADPSTADAALEPAQASHAPPQPIALRPDTREAKADGAASGARVAEHTALADQLQYTLTVPQAQERFAKRHRRVPAERTLQDYCNKQIIASCKIRTSIDGIARNEWLINETSLDAYIEKEPELQLAAPAADITSAAAHAARAVQSSSIHDTALTADSAASGARVAPMHEEPIGERRTLADILIENARILAQSEGKDLIIAEKNTQIDGLRDDRGFLREEIRESRKQRDQVKDIADRMLTTLESMTNTRRLSEGRDIAPETIRYKPVPEPPGPEGIFAA